MADLRELLRAAAEDPRSPLDYDGVVARARWRRRRRVAVQTAMLTALVALPLIVISGRSGDEQATVSLPSVSSAALGGSSTADVPPLPSGSSSGTGPTTPTPATTADRTTTTTAPSTTSTTVPVTSVPAVVDGMRTVTFLVVDAAGAPLPGVHGVQACPMEHFDWTVGCLEGLIIANDTDFDGAVEITLAADSEYYVQAFARNVGWPGGWTDPSGNVYHFSDGITTTGRDAPHGATLEIREPVEVVVEVVDDLGEHFPPGIARIEACEWATCQSDLPSFRVGVDDDGDGFVTLGLDAGVLYDAKPTAIGTGWCDPLQETTDGLTWHAGPSQLVTADELDGRRLVITNPCR